MPAGRRSLRSRVTWKAAALVLATMLIACAPSRRLPENVAPADRDKYGEFYNVKEYAKCMEQSRNPGNLACEYLRLTRVEEPEFWPYPEVPRPKLPAPPDPPVYREGMTGKDYFDALCKIEAGEFVYKVVEDVRGIYQIRPRVEASWDALLDRHVLEDPYGYTHWEATRPQSIFVQPGRYFFFETPVRDERGENRPLSFIRYSGQNIALGRYEKEERTTTVASRYGFLWRGIKRPFDRELGIAGGELIAVDLGSGEILGIRRGFVRSGFARSSRSGIQWESAEMCPRLRLHPQDFDKSGEFAFWFLTKVLRPSLH